MTLEYLIAQCMALLPEVIVSAALCAVIFADMFTPLRRSRIVCGGLAVAGAGLALAVFLVRLFAESDAYRVNTFGGMVVHDQVRAFFGVVILAGAIATFLFSMRSRETAGYRQGEYFSLMLGAVLGGLLLVSADNFILFILGLETLSLCSYVLAGYLKHERASAEASLKYMIYGAVVSGVLLFGLSYAYGVTGTMSIRGSFMLLGARVGAVNPLAALLILSLILVGVGFKIAMVPFHFWCPDVYQGAPTPVTAFLAVVSKAAGFGALLRLMMPVFLFAEQTTGGNEMTRTLLPVLFGVLAVVTMTYGNLVAIKQTDVKRLLAYSSIAHAGYLLMGMTVYTQAAAQAMMFYLFIYLFMTLGAFWVVIVLVNRLGSADIAGFRGAAYKSPYLFAAMFIFLISLTGLPPTAGFVGKFMLFKVVVAASIGAMDMQGGMTPMAAFYLAVALAGLLNSAVSLYYYMKIAKSMAFDAPADAAPLGDTTWDRVYAGALVVPTLLLLYFAPVLRLLELTAR